jgi:hypothetical protein
VVVVPEVVPAPAVVVTPLPVVVVTEPAVVGDVVTSVVVLEVVPVVTAEVVLVAVGTAAGVLVPVLVPTVAVESPQAESTITSTSNPASHNEIRFIREFLLVNLSNSSYLSDIQILP